MNDRKPTVPAEFAPGSSSGTFGRLTRLTLKELRETLRDRRTIITLILMPILVYPLLGVAFQRFLVTSLRPPEKADFHITVENEEARKIVERFVIEGESLLRHRQQRRNGNSETSSQGNVKTDDLKWSNFLIEVSPDLVEDVSTGKSDIGIRIPNDVTYEQAKQAIKTRSRISLEIVYQSGALRSIEALEMAERCLETLNDEVRLQRLRRAGLSPVGPAGMSRTALPSATSGSADSLSSLIPLILILMTITGAVYPAIDLTAGERERGTLEMLIAAPVPRMGLLLAKYATVLLVAVMTATINLVSMTVTVMATGLGTVLFGDTGLSFLLVVEIFGLLILFAAFFSAILLAVTSFARSFKEAQAYLIPLMIVSIAPGVFSLLPDLKLGGLLIVTPLANVVLLARDLLQNNVQPVAAAVVVVSTLVYALSAIMVAARIFGTDAILYGSPGTWSDLFRRPRQPSNACSPLAAVLALAVTFPFCFLLNQFAGQWLGGDIARQLAASGTVTVLVFGGIPVITMAFRHVRPIPALSLRGASPWAFLAAALLACSLWAFAYEMILGVEEAGLVTINEELKQYAEKLAAQLRSVSPALVLCSLAVLPAMFEELFFRGFLLSAFRQRMSGTQAVLWSALAFGVFHVIVRDALAVERFLPSFFLGLVLGAVCVRSGSLFPGILLHVLHNGLLTSLAYWKDEVTNTLPVDIVTGTHLPPLWLLSAGALAAAGFAVLYFLPRSVPSAATEESSGSEETIA